MEKYRQARWREPLLTEYPDRKFPLMLWEEDPEMREKVGPLRVPHKLARESPPKISGLSEGELVRHYTRLSQESYGVDSGPVPLGSCTMKYNPRIALHYAFNERLRLLHPLQPLDSVQGLLEIAYKLQEWLSAITGMDACSLHPAAGAQGELAGVHMIRKYHLLAGNDGRTEIIVPDSAHGTN
ncbi:MAG: aminomethyl-transferring glycine dehydrogenase subunit GcvPB, partial [Desulfurococcales archaeon]|nr:aminomethyl-transferring glycine dehydrogenase subunit GcvPB [Desulfurococcales archaeon]